MTLSYEDIYSFFLGYITDHNIAAMSMQDAYDLMSENLHKAVSKPYVRRLFSEFNNDSEIMTLTFEMDYKTDDNADKDFVLDILAKGMVIEWLQPQVKSRLLTAQYFGNSDKKYFSQSAHLNELQSLLEEAKLDQRKMIRDRGYISNSYLES